MGSHLVVVPDPGLLELLRGFDHRLAGIAGVGDAVGHPLHLRLQAGSEVMPFNEFQCSFDDDLYARAFMGLQQTLGVSGTGVSNGLSPEAFKKQCLKLNK